MKNVVTLVCLAAVASAIELGQLGTMKPHSGALSMYLNATSFEHLIQLGLPIASQVMLTNKTFETNIHQSAWYWKLDLDQLVVNNLTIGSELMEIAEGTNKLHVKLSEIEVHVDPKGSIDILHFIPLWASHLQIQNLSIDFTLESTSEDKVHWALVDQATVKMDNVNIQMTNKFLNTIVKWSRSLIDKMINSQMPKLTAYVNKQILAFNKMIANEQPTTFVIPIYGNDTDLNMTMTTAPQTTVGSDILKFFFDGLFVSDKV